MRHAHQTPNPSLDFGYSRDTSSSMSEILFGAGCVNERSAAARFHDGDELRESWWCSDIGFAEGDCSSDLVMIEVGESVEPGTLHLVWIGACPEVGEASAVDCGEASEETFNQTMRFGLLVCIR